MSVAYTATKTIIARQCMQVFTVYSSPNTPPKPALT